MVRGGFQACCCSCPGLVSDLCCSLASSTPCCLARLSRSLSSLCQGGHVGSPQQSRSGALQRHPQAVTQTHRDYIEAGADIIGTNTYQAHFQLFRKHLRFKASLALLKEKERHRTRPPWRKSRVKFFIAICRTRPWTPTF